eukprot:6455759-Amphidinium_carterae.3
MACVFSSFFREREIKEGRGYILTLAACLVSSLDKVVMLRMHMMRRSAKLLWKGWGSPERSGKWVHQIFKAESGCTKFSVSVRECVLGRGILASWKPGMSISCSR